MAGPAVKSAVPRAMLRSSSPSVCGGFLMPMSTGMTSHFATRAIRFAEEQPFARSAATRAVMDSSVCVTPWAITPLSAHSTTSARRLMLKRPLPTAAAMRVTRSSRSPRLFRGLATWLQRFSDSFSAFLSGPGMRELIFCRSSDTISSFSLSVSVRAARRPGAGKFRACAAAGFAGGLKFPHGNAPQAEHVGPRKLFFRFSAVLHKPVSDPACR